MNEILQNRLFAASRYNPKFVESRRYARKSGQNVWWKNAPWTDKKKITQKQIVVRALHWSREQKHENPIERLLSSILFVDNVRPGDVREMENGRSENVRFIRRDPRKISTFWQSGDLAIFHKRTFAVVRIYVMGFHNARCVKTGTGGKRKPLTIFYVFRI